MYHQMNYDHAQQVINARHGQLGQARAEPEKPRDVSKSTQGHQWNKTLQCMVGATLRSGFSFQFVAMLTGFVVYNLYGSKFFFTFDLFGTSESVRHDHEFCGYMILVEFVYLIGGLLLIGFQCFLSDNAKSARGYRAGSKLLSTAALLDVLVAALRLMQFIYGYRFLGTRSWSRYIRNTADWCLFYSSCLLHSVALILYGTGVFYLENYSAQGNSENVAWLTTCLFQVAGLLEFLLTFTQLGTLTTVMQLAATLGALVWALWFEPQSHSDSPELHDRDVSGTDLVEL